MEIITRKVAIVGKFPRFYTGIPCIHGHLAERYTISRSCVTCQKEYGEANNYKYKQTRLRYADTNKQKIVEYKKEYDAIRIQTHKIQRRAWWLQWARNNRKHRNAKVMLRLCKKMLATPVWVDEDELESVYLNCPNGYAVDHIVPLQGKNVSGLHVPWNLQYLTRSDNSKKKNKHESDGYV